MKMDYYVYVYLDPRKIGNYRYGDYIFEYEPFYIGKGREHRSKIHLQKVKRDDYKNLPKYNTIKKILDIGEIPIIIKYKKNIDGDSAFELEIEMIRVIGRFNKGGPLKNLSDGGEGKGRNFTEEHKRNISISKKGIVTEKMREHLAKIHSNMKGNKRTLGFKFSETSIKK